VPPLASERGANGQLLVCAKSPVTETDVIVSGTSWRFLKLSALEALVVFTAWPENDSELDDKMTGSTPAAKSETVCGLFAPVWLIVSVPVCDPRTMGEKVTWIVHCAPAAKTLGARGQFDDAA